MLRLPRTAAEEAANSSNEMHIIAYEPSCGTQYSRRRYESSPKSSESLRAVATLGGLGEQQSILSSRDR